jgi:hypothetical protein
MVRRRIAMLEVKQLARTVRGDGDTLVIGSRANDVVAPTPGKKARTGELDGHAAYMNRHQALRKSASRSDAYCVCTLASLRSAGAEPRCAGYSPEN